MLLGTQDVIVECHAFDGRLIQRYKVPVTIDVAPSLGVDLPEPQPADRCSTFEFLSALPSQDNQGIGQLGDHRRARNVYRVSSHAQSV